MSSDDDLHERMLAMARGLLDATKEGKISWRLTDVEDKFVYAGTRSSVTIQFTTDRYDGATTILSLLNNRGTVVDSLETEATQTEDKWEPAPWNDLLDDLYHAARRVVHNVDDALDSMMSDIERGTPSPPLKKNADPDPWSTKDPRSNKDPWSDEPPF
jgi:hypothetical protein